MAEPSPFGAVMDPAFRADVLRGLRDAGNRGVAMLFGGPADAAAGVVNAGLMAGGYLGNKAGLLTADQMPQPIEAPVGGSEWMGQQMERGGMVSSARNPMAEFLTAMILPGAMNKAGRAVSAVQDVAAANAAAPRTMNPQAGAIDIQALKAAFPDLDVSLRQTRDIAMLDKVSVPAGARNQGRGTEFMSALTKAADEDGARIGLTPSSEFGSSKGRLEDFYKRFGFKFNKGRSKDLELMAGMVRQPDSIPLAPVAAQKGPAMPLPDWAEDFAGVGGKMNPDGTVTVYHRTTPEAAEAIKKSGVMRGKEDGLFFSSASEGQAADYGSALVELRIPADKLQLDDLYDNEAHFRLPTKRAMESVRVADWLKK